MGAVTILGISLFAGNAQVWSTNGAYDTSRKQFYWSEEILPDHVAYPVLRIVDRAKLEIAEPVDRVYLQLEYAQHRYDAAQSLIEKGNTTLALTTLTKSQKYLLQAGQAALQGEPQLTETVRLFTLRTIEYYDSAIDEQKNSFGDADRAVLDNLQAELRSVIAQLKSAQSLSK